MDSSQEEKQIFLRQNILDKGYDTNLFVEFLIGKKGEGGADVGNWTMVDLKKVVKEFIAMQENTENNNNLNQVEPQPEINTPIINQNKNKIPSNPLENNPPKKKHVKYDPLSGGISTNNDNTKEDANKKNSSIKDFLISNKNKNNNQLLNNNINNNNINNNFNNNTNTINNVNLNNQNMINNQNINMNQQMQYLQQYLNLINSQNPQFQNQLLQYGLQNPQLQTNLQTNFQNINNINNTKTNNPLNNPIQKINNISSEPNPQSQTPPKTQVNKPEETKEQPNPVPPQEKQQSPPVQPEEEQNQNQKKDENEDIDSSLVYGIITNPIEDTKLVDKTPLTSEENPMIQVGFPEKVEGGFFSKAYVTYLITTNPLNIKVRRRYSDFDWLRQMMQNLFMYNVIPTNPRKNKFGSDKFGEPFLKKRMRTLEKFLNYSLMNPIIKSSQLFYDFISIENDADFQKKKKEYEKMKPPVNINDFQSPLGKVNVQINKKKTTYFENIKDNISFNENLLIKLNENFKILKTQIDNLTLKIDEIAQNWDDLCQNSIKYFEGDEIIKTYEHMNKLFLNWSEALKRHSTIMHIDVREYFKYIKNNFKSMKDLVSIVETKKNIYNKNENYLANKKEDLFKRGDINKWELNIDDRNNANNLIQDKSKALAKILPKETNNVIGMKKMYGFYLNRIIEEYERIKTINSNQHIKNLIYACEKLIEIYGDFQKGTADIINFFNNKNYENKNNANNNQNFQD